MPNLFNSPDTQKANEIAQNLKNQIDLLQQIGLPGVKDIPKLLWKRIQAMILTDHQIAKKILMISGSAYKPSISEERAQFMVYGKVYYKNGRLFDNDRQDPNCLATPGAKNNREQHFYFAPPLDVNTLIIKDIEAKIKELKEKLLQLGNVLGAFMIALIEAIAVIVVSLIALVSSIIILPFGSGIPTAITAVLTMIRTIKSLQEKSAELMPLLDITDIMSLVLPKAGEVIVSALNVIFQFITTIIGILTSILGLLGKVLEALGLAKKTMDEQTMEVDPSAKDTNLEPGESTKLDAGPSGGGWNYDYQWTDDQGNVISTKKSPTVTPEKTTTYTVKLTDKTTGETKTNTVRVKIRPIPTETGGNNGTNTTTVTTRGGGSSTSGGSGIGGSGSNGSSGGGATTTSSTTGGGSVTTTSTTGGGGKTTTSTTAGKGTTTTSTTVSPMTTTTTTTIFPYNYAVKYFTCGDCILRDTFNISSNNIYTVGKYYKFTHSTWGSGTIQIQGTGGIGIEYSSLGTDYTTCTAACI
jgi:hypothetical protein